MSHTEPTNRNLGTRIGVLIQACDGELEIGREGLHSITDSLGAENLFVQVIDDASKHQVGESLSAYCGEIGVQSRCHTMKRPLGYRGMIPRVLIGLNLLAQQDPAFDLVIKIDTDTLVLNKTFGDVIKSKCQNPNALWGIIHTLRKRDLLLMLSDMLPVGFRRKFSNGQIQRKWELSRLQPVWWTDLGYRVLLRGQPINKIATGGAYIIAGPLLQRFKELGYLDRDATKRYGFVTSEEDTIVSLLARASGGEIIDIHEVHANFGNMRIPPDTTLEHILTAGYSVIHPLKPNPRANQLRQEIKKAKALRDTSH